MNTGHGRWLVSLQVDSNQPTEARSVRHTSQVAYLLSSIYLSVLLFFLVVPIAEDHELLNSTSAKSSHCTYLISTNSCTLHRDTGRAHTSCIHVRWISLRHNYTLYSDTISLNFNTWTPTALSIQTAKFNFHQYQLRAVSSNLMLAKLSTVLKCA